MRISIIVAVSKNGVIGRDNQLIWRLPNDLKQFKQLTMGHPMIMGRKTFESIGKPLPGRTSIVVSRNPAWQADGCATVNSLEAALGTARQTDTEEVFVIGGAEIYRLALPFTHKIYLTQVHAEVAGDAFFEIPNPEDWQETARIYHPADEKHDCSFDFVELICENS